MAKRNSRSSNKLSRQKRRNITVSAEARDEPDYQQLARAVVELAKQMEAETSPRASDPTDDASQPRAA